MHTGGGGWGAPNESSKKGNDHLIEFQLIKIVIFQLIKSFNNE